jgi:Rrf2 family protein
MMLSQTAEYALRAVLVLADRAAAGPMGAGRLAQLLKVPQNYLSKTLNQLVRAGILVSTRGKGGGFQLARPAGQIRLLEIVAPFDAIPARRVCLLGRPQCSDTNPCPAHVRWRDVGERTTRFFRDTTVADLIH